MITHLGITHLLHKMAADSEDDHTVRNAALAALGIGSLGAGGYGVKKLIDARKAAQRASKIRRGLGKGLGGLAALGLLGGGGYYLSQNPEAMAGATQWFNGLAEKLRQAKATEWADNQLSNPDDLEGDNSIAQSDNDQINLGLEEQARQATASEWAKNWLNNPDNLGGHDSVGDRDVQLANEGLFQQKYHPKTDPLYLKEKYISFIQ